MKRTICITVFIVAIMMALPSMVLSADYVGSEACAKCHMEKYNDWKTSGHPYKLRLASEAKLAPLPVPKGYTWDDISYVIGGFRWKSRYIDKQGYIITADKQGNAMPTQWNMASGTWVNFHPGEKTPYKCGPCHMTGYSAEGHQDGLEGIVGTWAMPGIHCEECHGPGGIHAVKGEKGVTVERGSALCGKCHIRGEKEKIPAKNGYIQHHEQYNEFTASPHTGKVECVTCHDPHKPARFGVKLACSSCHSKQGADFSGSIMERAGITCVDCHMPKAGVSAEPAAKYEGDVRTHNWRISTDPAASMFTEDGKFASGYVTLDFVCLNCHGSRDMNWAAKNAKGIHSYGK